MNYFLIVGNTRVGSTWLETSLDLLPEITCRREIRWKMPYASWASIHCYIDSTTRSLRERIESVCQEHRHDLKHCVAIGSKLKFDPYGFGHPSSFAALKAILEPEITTILLRRSYLEIFATWKTIGIRHRLTGRRSLLERSDPVLLAEIAKQHDISIPKAISLLQGGLYCGQVYSELSAEERLDYPIEQAIEDMLVFFCNDLQALMLTEECRTRVVVDYRDIVGKFPEVATMLGTQATNDELVEIVNDPVTHKLAGEDQIGIDPREPLAAVSACLDQAYERCRSRTAQPEDIMDFDLQAGVVRFRIPGLQAIFERFDCFSHLRDRAKSMGATMTRYSPRDKPPSWDSIRPIYLPDAYAVPPDRDMPAAPGADACRDGAR